VPHLLIKVMRADVEDYSDLLRRDKGMAKSTRRAGGLSAVHNKPLPFCLFEGRSVRTDIPPCKSAGTEGID